MDTPGLMDWAAKKGRRAAHAGTFCTVEKMESGMDEDSRLKTKGRSCFRNV